MLVSVSRMSVVIPMHNAARYISATLDSMAAQTVPPHEVIVVDDGSTDDGAAIVSAYRFPDGSRPRLIQNPTPLGVAIARNRGVFHASGEWIGLCDNDDLWHPQRIELVLRAAAARPDAHAISTGATAFALASERAVLDAHQRGRMVEHWVSDAAIETLMERVVGTDGPTKERPTRREITFADLRADTCYVTTQVCFRRESYALAGGCAPWCSGADDWVLNAAASLLAPIVHLEVPLVFYRIRADSQSHSEAGAALTLLSAALALRLGGRQLDRRPAGKFYNHLVRLGARDGWPLPRVLALGILGDMNRRQLASVVKARLRSRSG
jgi:glycosyltransferase involved in cell wall biosynthesis